MDIRTMHETYTDADYVRIAAELKELVGVVQKGNDEEKKDAALKIKGYLDSFIKIPELENLTAIYRNAPDDNVIGFSPQRVLQFITAMEYHYNKKDDSSDEDKPDENEPDKKDPVVEFLSDMHGMERFARVKGINAELETVMGILQIANSALSVLNSRLDMKRSSDDISDVFEREVLLGQKARVLDEKERLIDWVDKLKAEMKVITDAEMEKDGKLSDA